MQFRKGRWEALGGLRFALAAIVLSCHMKWFSPAHHFLERPGERLSGLTAVLGFLIISGYSIAHSISRQPIGFYRRRVLRIYPLYGAAVLFSILPFVLAGKSIHTPQMGDVHFVIPTFPNVLTNLCFLQGFVGSPLSSNDVVWTLAVEVACYLMAPLLAKMKTSTVIIIAGVSAASFAYYPRLHLGYYADLSFGLPLLFLAWAWLAGFAFYRHRDNPVAAAALIAVGAVLVNFNNAFGAQFSVMTIALSALVVVAAAYITLPSIFLRVLSYLGDLSYPFYLFHLPALLLAWAVLGIRNPWLLAGFSIAVSAVFLLMDTALKVLLRPREPAEAMPVQTQSQLDLEELTGISTS